MLAKIPMNISLPPKNERQQSFKDLWQCILDNQSAMQMRQPIIIVQAATMGKSATADIATAS